MEQVLGTDELFSYLHKYRIELDPQLEALVGRLDMLSFVVEYYDFVKLCQAEEYFNFSLA